MKGQKESILIKCAERAIVAGVACGTLLKAHELGLVDIIIYPDPDYSFEDHCGDSFDPVVNNDIPAEQLKLERAKEYRRFNREGAFNVECVAFGDTLDSMGGFVGYDFIGSGCDSDFIRALQKVVDAKFIELRNYLNEAYSL